jgi:hypothetical protein
MAQRTLQKNKTIPRKAKGPAKRAVPSPGTDYNVVVDKWYVATVRIATHKNLPPSLTAAEAKDFEDLTPVCEVRLSKQSADCDWEYAEDDDGQAVDGLFVNNANESFKSFTALIKVPI